MQEGTICTNNTEETQLTRHSQALCYVRGNLWLINEQCRSDLALCSKSQALVRHNAKIMHQDKQCVST